MSVVDVEAKETDGARALRAANLASMVMNRHPTSIEPDLPQPPMGWQGQEDYAMHNESRKPIFDPTINLGHVLTAIAIAGGGAGIWSATERRLALQEERQAQTNERVAEQKEVIREIRNDVKDVQRTVNDIVRSATPKRGQ
ncbi:hypothetical protein [Ramlibacter sp.]|uniref:hypothetical protein n=1 Tax=Ramlibacter sp. TaxID=1917967 RepID=UPI003D0C284D